MKNKSITIFLLTAILATAAPQRVAAWWDYGHRVIAQIARGHLDQAVLESIDAILGHDFVEDASWMDEHRSDPELSYAYYWHNCAFVEGTTEINAEYGFEGGGASSGLLAIEENLKHFETLSPENKALLIRMAVHFVGDLHCPAHAFYEMHVQKWSFIVDGEVVPYHGYYDSFPDKLYDGLSPYEAALILDKCRPSEIKRASKGNVSDWVTDCGKASLSILEINPLPQDRYSSFEPAADTWERSKPIIERQLRYAGYRLAALLNRYLK